MKHCLLLCAAVLALALSVPASAQYIYLDVNGDGVCDANDVLNSSVTGVDVWLDTNHDKNGNPVSCPQATVGETFTMNSYFFILSSTGGVTYGTNGNDGLTTWANNVPGFTAPGGGAQAGNDIWLARASSTAVPEGKYLLGTMPIHVTGSPVLSILALDPDLDGTAITGFGSQCPGVDFLNTIRLGDCAHVGQENDDFCDVCGTSAGTPVTNKTWGQIKDMYRH